MRLKISFEDIKLLFDFLDKDKDGALGYEEFTMLLEEKWRGIDHVTHKDNVPRNPMLIEPNMLTEANDVEMFNLLEGLAKSKLKIPVKHTKLQTTKITSQSAENFISESREGERQGKRSFNEVHNMAEIMKHNYL